MSARAQWVRAQEVPRPNASSDSCRTPRSPAECDSYYHRSRIHSGVPFQDMPFDCPSSLRNRLWALPAPREPVPGSPHRSLRNSSPRMVRSARRGRSERPAPCNPSRPGKPRDRRSTRASETGVFDGSHTTISRWVAVQPAYRTRVHEKTPQRRAFTQFSETWAAAAVATNLTFEWYLSPAHTLATNGDTEPAPRRKPPTREALRQQISPFHTGFCKLTGIG